MRASSITNVEGPIVLKRKRTEGSVGVEKQLRCITCALAARTLTCALYFAGVIFLMRRVSSIISRSGSTVTQDMCQRCIDVSNGCVAIELFVLTKNANVISTHF